MEGGSNYETLFVCICTGQLSCDDLRLVLNEVWPASSKWFNIGLELGLEVSDLNVINKSSNRDVDWCLLGCLKVWLRGSHPLPTWSAMIKALRSPTVGFAALADRIVEKYGKESIIYLHKHSLSKFASCGIDFINPRRMRKGYSNLSNLSVTTLAATYLVYT